MKSPPLLKGEWPRSEGSEPGQPNVERIGKPLAMISHRRPNALHLAAAAECEGFLTFDKQFARSAIPVTVP